MSGRGYVVGMVHSERRRINMFCDQERDHGEEYQEAEHFGTPNPRAWRPDGPVNRRVNEACPDPSQRCARRTIG